VGSIPSHRWHGGPVHVHVGQGFAVLVAYGQVRRLVYAVSNHLGNLHWARTLENNRHNTEYTLYSHVLFDGVRSGFGQLCGLSRLGLPA